MGAHTEDANGAAPATPAAIIHPPAREVRVVHDVIPVLDTGRFEHMQRIAHAMATMSVCPDALCMTKNNAGDLVPLPKEVVVANCFMVVNQAVRWNMDPFAVAQAVSIIHGKLCYEGKLIHAVIEAKLGIRLKYDFDDGAGNKLGVIVSGHFHDEDEPRTIEGKVEDWHTGSKGPWANLAAWPRQLRYRGAREWARAHAPGVILGVYSDDEMEDLREERRMRDITPPRAAMTPPPPPAQLAPPPPPPQFAPPARAADTAVSETVEADPAPQSGPPVPPPRLRAISAKSTGTISDPETAAVAGPRKRSTAAGKPSRARRAPATSSSPPPPLAKPTGGGEGPTRINPPKYLEKLEHDITSCERMDQVQALWDRHEALMKANPGALTEKQINAALGFYFDAQQVLGD